MVAVVALVGLAMAVKIVRQYEKGVLFRFGRLIGTREPGLRLIVPFVDVLHRVSLRIVTMPIQSQGIITRDNVSVDVSAVAYFRVVDAVKSVIAVENVGAAINQIAQTTLRKVVGQHTLDETLSETDRINIDIREILDITTTDWGVEVALVELKDIQLPDSMKRAMARQAEAEREKRAKIISAEGESMAAAALGDASDIMMAHPLALQLRNLQSLVEIGAGYTLRSSGSGRRTGPHTQVVGWWPAAGDRWRMESSPTAGRRARSLASPRPGTVAASLPLADHMPTGRTRPGDPMAGIRAVIHCDGHLEFRDDALDPVDEGGRPLHADTFIIQRAGWGGPGLHGDTGPARDFVAASLFNGTATSVVSALGGPEQSILGSLVIGGDHDQPGYGAAVPCGLTTAQQHLIRDVHGAVLRNADAGCHGDGS
ncbi:slipin family protein [Streptomyces sp. Mg1]|uniref:slipin family protein n=1 Tax=Streptomyces sp. Mg1 TaxID=465541 RepID=UPI001F3900D9|nr:slipin family protein [Streptomyces sp. Mg1]